jgi:cytochrome c peroxidase
MKTMQSARIRTLMALALASVATGPRPAPAQAKAASAKPFVDSSNPSGVLRTVTLDGSPIDTTSLFFQPLGINGRSCASCHVAASGWSISPAELKDRFNDTKGLDPIFRTVDGSNSPRADVSTVGARRKAYSMLLRRGVIRVGLPIPAGAEFTLQDVDDPYGYAGASELSLFRRPLPATNLRFLTTVMWDGRESSLQTGTLPIFTPTPDAPLPPQFAKLAAYLAADLRHQANDATTGHAQAMLPGLTDDQRAAIVAFEMNLATAQHKDNHAGLLDVDGARGGPEALAQQTFYVSINDPLHADVSGEPFQPDSMTLFDAWGGSRDARRASIARGAELFGTFSFNITGVAGLNDVLFRPVIPGTCTTCHDAPNVGNHSVAMPLNIGTADASRRYKGLPLYTLKNTTTGETVQTTDPGRALVTGKWVDIGKFKGPVLRGLAARAPYFHNGLADGLDDVLDFYETRFDFTLTDQQRDDLIAFLKAL